MGALKTTSHSEGAAFAGLLKALEMGQTKSWCQVPPNLRSAKLHPHTVFDMVFPTESMKERAVGGPGARQIECLFLVGSLEAK